MHTSEEEYTEEDYKKMKPGQLTDLGICPTCFDRNHDGCIFKSKKEETLVYEDEDFEIFFASNPRSAGHMVISTAVHYQDMSEAPEKLNDKIFRFARKLMIILVEVYHCERVYLCTMCDGLKNHYHVQLIPRYSFEKRGSENFVKPRIDYIFDEEKFNAVKQKIADYANEFNGNKPKA